MDLDAVGVVVMNDVGHGMKLVVDVDDLSAAGDGVDQQSFGFALLVGLVAVFVEPKNHRARRVFRGRWMVWVHKAYFRDGVVFCNPRVEMLNAGNDDVR